MKISDVKIFIKETLRGKSVGRILVNLEFRKKEYGGDILDIGSGNQPSFYRFLNISQTAKIKTVDISPECHPDFILDMEKDKIPVSDFSFNAVFAFSIIEHLSDYHNLLDETYRVLKPKGKFLCIAPFLINVHPDPHDYTRFTKEKLEMILKEAGFEKNKITAVGFGPFVAAYYLVEFTIPTKILKLFASVIAISLDKIIQKIKPDIDFKERFVLCYIIESEK